MKRSLILLFAFLLVFALLTPFTFMQDRTPAYSNTTNAANLDLWGGWDGVTMTKVAGETGLVTDVLIEGGGGTGGCLFSLNAGGCASGTHSNSSYKGLIDATELIIKYKSTANIKGTLVLEYRLSPQRVLQTKSFTMPSTGGQWSELLLPFSALEPDVDGKWVYNINGAYQTTNFNPVVLLKLENINFGTTHTATISSITTNWYQEDMVSEVSIEGYKPSYYQHYDQFDYSQGVIKIKRGGSSEVAETLSLTDPRVTITGYNNTVIKNSSTETSNLRMTATVLNKSIYFYVKIIPFAPPNLTGITINSPKTQYLVNDIFDLATGTITATYSDKDPETVALNNPNVTISGFQSSAPASNQMITVTYGGRSATYAVNILEFVANGPISVVGAKRIYKVGERFDWHTGLIMPASGNSAKLYSRHAAVSGFSSSAPAENNVITVTYGGHTTTYTVDIIADELPVKYYLEQTMQEGSRPTCWQWGSSYRMGFVDGTAEDGITTALHATGDGTHGGGGAIVFTAGNCGGGNVTMPDGTVLSGFIGMDAIKFRYRSTASMDMQFRIEYYVSGYSKNSSKITLPSTNGVWTDYIVPLKSFDSTSISATDEPTLDAIDWLYHMKSNYTTDFEPNIQLRVNGKFLGDDYFSIDHMNFLWYEDNPVESISVSGLKTQYTVDSALDRDTGQVLIHYKDGSTRSVKLKDASVLGFDSSVPVTNQGITVSYAGQTAAYQIHVFDSYEYIDQKFENLAGVEIFSFEGQDGVVAKVFAENTDPVIKQPYGVLLAVAYHNNKVAIIKKLHMQEIPQGVTELSAQFSAAELASANATKIKIIALIDSQGIDSIFTTAKELIK